MSALEARSRKAREEAPQMEIRFIDRTSEDQGWATGCILTEFRDPKWKSEFILLLYGIGFHGYVLS